MVKTEILGGLTLRVSAIREWDIYCPESFVRYNQIKVSPQPSEPTLEPACLIADGLPLIVLPVPLSN